MKIRKNSVSGVALIIVLGFLVIISALTVAFFSSVNTELKASRTFAAGVTTRQLADSSVQIVMGQIASATTRGIDSTGAGHEAWASQPGMIRVFGSNNGGTYLESDQADAFFKLYSSDKMMLTGADLTTFVSTPDYIKDWDKSPAYWTDLNAPVIVRDSNNKATPRFPIIDPRAYKKAINPASPDWTDNVEGFYYDTTSTINGVVGPGNADEQRIPMPVRWIYILQDGTLTTPDSSGTGTTASFATAAVGKKPTATNPIVGRIAFWTDDETCKLNLNTAAGHSDNLSQLPAYQNNPPAYAGSYWDTPRFYTQFDYGIPTIVNGAQNGIPDPNQASGGLALCQLLQFEFQRYPGHPATTSLAPVLHNLLTSEQFYAITPRYSNLNLSNQVASTKGGTFRVVVDPLTPAKSLDNQEIQPKSDRLYATLDELMFAAHNQGTQSTNANYARTPINTGVYPVLSTDPLSPISPTVIDQLRFFVSTQGRAPELNLFGQPRVSCWPVRGETDTEVTGMNAYDNLVLFCSTVGNAATNATTGRPNSKADNSAQGVYRYVFTRREVISTNLTSTAHPDQLGDNPKTMDFTGSYIPDSEQPRNAALLGTYLNGLTSRAIPGTAGANFSNKYAANDRQGILAEIFDYIRMANSQDTTTSLTPPAKAIKFAPGGVLKPSLPSYFKANGVQAKGFGRMSTLCEASLVFYYAGPLMDPEAGTATSKVNDLIPINLAGYQPNIGSSRWDMTSPTGSSYPNRALRYVKLVDDSTSADYGKVKAGFMRAFLLFSTFDPMQGYAPKADPADGDAKLTIECTWQNDFQVNVGGGNVSLAFPPVNAPVTTTVYRAPASSWGGRNLGGYEGFQHTLHGAGSAARPYKIMQMPPKYAVPSIYGWNYLNPATPVTSSPPSGGDYGEFWAPGTAASPGGTFVARPFTTVASTVQEYYPFQTDMTKPVLVDNKVKSFAFIGGRITTKLYYGGGTAMQQFDLNFPSSTTNWPVPQGAPQTKLNAVAKTNVAQPCPTADVSTWLGMPVSSPSFGTAPGTPAGFPGGQGLRSWYWTGNGAFFANTALGIRVAGQTAQNWGTNFETSLQASWSFATRLAWVDVANGDSSDPHTNASNGPISPGWWGDRWRCIVQPGDTIRSLLYWDGKSAGGAGQTPLTGAGQITGGDLRVGALSASVAQAEFQPHPDYYKPYSRACVLRQADGSAYFPSGTVQPLVGGATKTSAAPAVVYASAGDGGNYNSYYQNPSGQSGANFEAVLGNHINLGTNKLKFPNSRAFGNLPWGGGPDINLTGAVNGVMRRESAGGGKYPGDFDTGLGDFPDGPFINKQDEGNVVYSYFDSNTQQTVYPVPYFTSTWTYQPPGNTFTSPSRQMPSPVMFGSLPSRPTNGGGLGWTTLAFSPNTAGDKHPGNFVDPKDHYLLDLFMMPVVEPYPISEPFSTAGKVNLNYRIAPFNYIKRSTALRGALYPLRVTAVNSQHDGTTNQPNYLYYKTGLPTTAGDGYYPFGGKPISANFRLRLDRDTTIQAMDGFFDSGSSDPSKGFFKSASQICERYLYSQDSAKMDYGGTPDAEVTKMRTWWDTNGDLTGDNMREKPYVDLYPRVTTKSNTYTVHMRVQTLRQTPGHPDQWIEGKDAVLGEYRGSATIERYLDPADPRFAVGNSPQFNPDKVSLEPMYRFRTVYSRKFTP